MVNKLNPYVSFPTIKRPKVFGLNLSLSCHRGEATLTDFIKVYFEA